MPSECSTCSQSFTADSRKATLQQPTTCSGSRDCELFELRKEPTIASLIKQELSRCYAIDINNQLFDYWIIIIIMVLWCLTNVCVWTRLRFWRKPFVRFGGPPDWVIATNLKMMHWKRQQQRHWTGHDGTVTAMREIFFFRINSLSLLGFSVLNIHYVR